VRWLLNSHDYRQLGLWKYAVAVLTSLRTIFDIPIHPLRVAYLLRGRVGATAKVFSQAIYRLLWRVLEQLQARRNLYVLRDRRCASLNLGETLITASTTWPGVLPWNWRPKTIFDVGAHVGKIADQLTQLYRPDFIGLVEPLPHLAAQLRTRTFAPRQDVFACALGRTADMAKLNVLASAPSTSLLEVAPGCDELFHCPMDVQEIIDVPVRTLDSVFDECGLEDLDLLKVDVQGYELEVFAGGNETLRRTRVVVCEVSFFEHYIGQPLFPVIYQYLIENGYALHGTFGYLYDKRGRPLQCDAVFVNLAKL